MIPVSLSRLLVMYRVDWYFLVSLLSMWLSVSVWSVLICSGLSGLVCSGLVCSGLVWSLVWSGVVYSHLVWASLVWSGLKFISVSRAYSKITKSRIHHPHRVLHFFPWLRYNYIELKLWPYTWPIFLSFKTPKSSPHVLNIRPERISWNGQNNFFVCPWL